MKSSPKLKRIITQIQEILIKEEVAGVVTIHEPGFCHTLHELTPKYSCVIIKPQKIGFLTANNNYPSAAAKTQALIDTSNMLRMLSHKTSEVGLKLITVSESFDRVAKAEHVDVTTPKAKIIFL